MKSKRMYERCDVSKELISVEITNNGNAIIMGMVKDISKSGISFYAFDDSILHEMGKYIYISFVYKNVPFHFEVEILREAKSNFGYLCAGRFVGVTSLVQTNKNNLLTLLTEKELVLV